MGGIDSIKSHPFFKGLDWNKLLKKEIKAPINPEVLSEGDY